VVLELERADRVRDALDRVRHAVRPVVARVDAPGLAGAVVSGVADAVHHRVAQVDVAALHVDLRAQHVRAVGMLSLLHFFQQFQILADRAVAERAVAAVLGERAAVSADLLGGERVDVGQAALDQVAREAVQLLEVIRGVVLVLAPVETEPAHRVDDRVDVFLLFLSRVGVVEAQVAHAAVVAREAEIEADRLGVAEVQVPVGLRREARAHALVLAAGKVVLDNLADEIGRRGSVRGLARGWGHSRISAGLGREFYSSGRGPWPLCPDFCPA
jgi:hypothetical protein